MGEQEQKQDHIRCRTIIEILGKPKEHVEQTLKLVVKKAKDLGVKIINESEFLKIVK